MLFSCTNTTSDELYALQAVANNYLENGASTALHSVEVRHHTSFAAGTVSRPENTASPAACRLLRNAKLSKLITELRGWGNAPRASAKHCYEGIRGDIRNRTAAAHHELIQCLGLVSQTQIMEGLVLRCACIGALVSLCFATG